MVTRPHQQRTFFLHDNARPHTAKKTKDKFRILDWEVLPHPPYSPDLAPSDFKLFRSLANALRGEEFKTQQEVEEFVQQFFDSKPPGFFVSGFTDLPSRWDKVIEYDGDYPPGH